jgi:hypothetical protein
MNSAPNQETLKSDLFNFAISTALKEADSAATYQSYEEICKKVDLDHELSEKIAKLKLEGGGRDTLLLAVAIAGHIFKTKPKLRYDCFDGVAKRVRELVDEMKRLSALPLPSSWTEQSEMLAVSFDLHAELNRKAEVYESIDQLFRSPRAFPRRDTIARIACIWPTVYLKAKTNKSHNRLVADLLRLVGVVSKAKDKTRLAKTDSDLYRWLSQANAKNWEHVKWMKQRIVKRFPFRRKRKSN